MSKELDLIKAMKILLECTDMDALQSQSDALIGRAIELLAQPEQENLTPRQRLKEYKKGYAQAELDLKREPLSDEEMEQATQGMSKFGADMFKSGVSSAERTHGIGVDDE